MMRDERSTQNLLQAYSVNERSEDTNLGSALSSFVFFKGKVKMSPSLKLYFGLSLDFFLNSLLIRLRWEITLSNYKSQMERKGVIVF